MVSIKLWVFVLIARTINICHNKVVNQTRKQMNFTNEEVNAIGYAVSVALDIDTKEDDTLSMLLQEVQDKLES